MDNGLKTDYCHDNDENKFQEQLKELFELIEQNNIKCVDSWIKTYNDSKTIVCIIYSICFHDITQ